MATVETATKQTRPAEALPRWDLTPLFPGLASPEFTRAFAALGSGFDALERLYDHHDVRPHEQPPAVSAADLEAVITATNDQLAAVHLVDAYLYGLVTADSRDDLAQARTSELELLNVRGSKLSTRLTGWLGSLGLEPLLRESAVAAAHAFPLRKLKRRAMHLMSPAEEALAAELDPSGGGAWAKLHGNLTSQIEVALAQDGETDRLPMSAVRNLAHDPSREVRRNAYEAELAAWERHALPLAAAMNGIKGQVNLLTARRGWADPLDLGVFQNNIDRDILDALLAAARAAFPDFRRYLKLKARALGVPALAWYDLFAPVGASERTWTWPEATAFITQQFGTFSPKMRGLAERAFAESWVDAGPRLGKVGGAYCMSTRPGESRVLMNFSSSYDSVSTLAHELGHAYHNLNEKGLTQLQQQTPMVLAETASIFCETVIREAALAEASPAEQRYILEQSLQGSCQVVVDIISRFDFERSVFAARGERELAIAELNALMLSAQRGTYGDGLDESLLHPYMWAVKPHHYDQNSSFYNYPYLFGLLFGLGLFVQYQQAPASFPERYDELLAWTGRASAADLGQRFGIDLRAEAFWRGSLDFIRRDVDRLEALLTVD